jgi:hypothetical protein
MNVPLLSLPRLTVNPSGDPRGAGEDGLRATVYVSIPLPDETMPCGLSGLQCALADAAQRMTEMGHPVRYVNGMYMPAESRLLCVFAAESEDAVRATVRLLRIPFVPVHTTGETTETE